MYTNSYKNKKILIIGCCGAGKSYFARELAQITNLPLYHIDKIRWYTDWTLMPSNEFIPILENIMLGDEWIIDGNYISSLEFRMKYADTIFYFDFPADKCLEGIEQRKGKPREDMPDGMIDRNDPEFIDFIKNFQRDTAPRIKDLLSKFEGDIIIFKSREEKDKYLFELLQN